MFEHLLAPEYDHIENIAPSTLLDAQVSALAFLDEDDDPAAMPPNMQRMRQPTPNEATEARKAFAAMTLEQGLQHDTHKAKRQRDALLQLKTPEAVRHLVGMLSAYDWDFVEQAKEIRGYVVAQLLEKTKSPDARIALRALELTGKLTEVAAFTERSEVTHKQEPATVIEERLRARLMGLLPPAQPVEDVEVRAIAIVSHAPGQTDKATGVKAAPVDNTPLQPDKVKPETPAP